MLGRLGSMQHVKGDDEDDEDDEGGQRDAGHMMMTLIPLKSHFIRR